MPQVQRIEKGSVNPVGRWSGFESGGTLTSCRQSQEKVPQVQGEERRVSESIQRAMDCYVTVQESGKQLTLSPALLPLIVQVMK
jgi:hypothetical protein|eukprot:2895540-Prymnesium_polylepis.1